jgi:HD-like signal output (HDOD) protein
MVRSVATSFAMSQLRQLAWLRPLRPHLQRIWQDSIAVASVAYVGAQGLHLARPDEALTAGLFHQLGRLYLVTRAHREGLPVVVMMNGGEDERAAWADTVAHWHPVIARAILESWGSPADLAEAVEAQDALLDSDDPIQLPPLVRLVSAAKIWSEVQAAPQGDPAQGDPAQGGPARRDLLARVHFGSVDFLALVEPRQADIAKVRQILGQGMG